MIIAWLISHQTLFELSQLGSCRKEKVRKNIPCPKIVQQYNKSMGGVDMADMLLPLHRQSWAKRWYQKIFWHLIDMAKINAWILQRRQENKPKNEEVWRHQPRVKSLLKHCLSPMFALIKLHNGQAVLPIKMDADCAVWPAECNLPNARSFSVYWLIATISLISIQNHRQISSCTDFFPNRKVLGSY